MFHVGQKVVCVNDAFPPEWSDTPNLPRRGRVYTVRETCTFVYAVVGLSPAIRLEELVNPPVVLAWIGPARILIGEIPFWAERFRPITERKTDISIFTDMLTSAPKEIEHVDD